MLISKSRFLNLIRCNRFAAFYELETKGEDGIVTFDPNTIEGIYAEEAQERKRIILESLFGSQYGDQDDLDLESEMELIKDENPFEDDYNEIELIAARVLKNRYPGSTVHYGLKTFTQKHFEAEYEGYKFHCFLDVYVETDDEIIVAEVKASTSRGLMDRGGKNPLFIEGPTGIYYRNFELNPEESKKANMKFIKDPFHNLGRMGFDLAFQRFVIERYIEQNGSLGKPIKYLLAVLDHEYVFDGKVDNLQKPVYSDNIIRLFEYTKITEELQPLILEYSEKVVDRVNNVDLSLVSIGKHCQLKSVRECPYYENGCKKDKNIPDFNSIFTYIGNHNKFPMSASINEEYDRFDLIDLGYTKALDFEEDDLRDDKQKTQRRAILTKEPYYDTEFIKKGIDMIKYPIYHLDFETFGSPLPRFKGEKCYTQSVFQYSLHIEREPGECHPDLDHYEFLAKDSKTDQREELYNHLISKLDDPNGMILAYNVSFEQTRLRDLNKLFPQHSKIIEPLIESAFDLMLILKGSGTLFKNPEPKNKILFYDDQLNGSYSIKKVLPIFAPEINYKNLEDVQKGTDAVLQFSKLANMNPGDYAKMYQNLLAYCKLDTWAMVVILKELKEIVKDK